MNQRRSMVWRYPDTARKKMKFKSVYSNGKWWPFYFRKRSKSEFTPNGIIINLTPMKTHCQNSKQGFFQLEHIWRWIMCFCNMTIQSFHSNSNITAHQLLKTRFGILRFLCSFCCYILFYLNITSCMQ